jgi:hypothetical protein
MTFDLLDEFRLQAHLSFDWLEAIVEDVTPEQALWQPPGRANTIAVNYAHIVRNIDEDFNQRLFRRPRLNEGPWLGKTGLIDGVEDWEQPHIDWPALHAYGLAMTSFLYETMDALTYDDLDRLADLSTPDLEVWRGIDIVRLTVSMHVRLHGGEIACLKGLQGAKGYRSGLDTDRA